VDLCIAGDELLLHRLSPDVPEDIPRIYTLGPALSVWLECKGIPALHGCCVEVAGNGVAFLSDSGGGKSNIALAALLAGEALMSDDIVAVEAGPTTVVRPSFPQMRLWPEDIPAGWGRAEDYPVVHPELSKRRLVIGEGARGRYQPDSRPLACIYLPVRSTTTDTCTFDGLGPSDAIMELVRCSFSPDFVDVAGLAPQRLSRLAQIVSTVPVRRLEYPPGRERLPAVWEAIMSDYRAIAG
jgi:hypothetical protein